MTLRLTISYTLDNPRIMPLKDGTVQPEGIELEWRETPSLFYHNLVYDDLDVSEMSISSTLLARERTDGTRWDWSALPVLLSSGGLVWMPTYVNTSSGIRELRDLKGKRFGMPDYHMTAALWLRITLKDLYGIEARDVTWYNGRSRGMSRDEVLGLDKDPPPGVNLNYIDEGQTLDSMLDRGELDAAFGVDPAHAFSSRPDETMHRGGTQMAGNPRLRPLFSDGGKAVMAEYHQKFGGFHQPNHHVIVQNRILREHPWAAMSLFNSISAVQAGILRAMEGRPLRLSRLRRG